MTLPLQLDSGTTTSLPDDFARDLGRRVTLAGLSLGGLWTLVALLQRLTLGWGGRNPLTYAAWDRFGGVLSAGVVGASLLLAWAGRRLRNRPRSMLRLVLGYELVIAAAVALISQWHPPDAARGISWNCLVILLFPALAPARPALILMTSLLVATAEPLMYALAVRAGVADPPLPAHQLFWSFAPAYLCAFLAVIPAAVLRRLGTALREARELGNYRLGERIGAGGMGEVFRASHRLLARPAAVKLVSPGELGARDQTGQALLAERFRREAAAAATLRSPHTIELYDFGVAADGTLYYAMELLEGIDLQTLVERHGALPPARVVHLLRQVCRSLGEAHVKGFVHRDIKPSNIMICRMGTEVDYVKVLDFGLVKVPATDDAGLTAADVTAGTPAYLPPEAIGGAAAVDHRADLYALGCVAYWLLSARPVFRAPSAVGLLLKHASEAPPRLTSPVASIPVALEAIVMRCLEKDPAHRPADARAIERSLEQLGIGQLWSDMEATEWWNVHRPATAPVPVRATPV